MSAFPQDNNPMFYNKQNFPRRPKPVGCPGHEQPTQPIYNNISQPGQPQPVYNNGQNCVPTNYNNVPNQNAQLFSITQPQPVNCPQPYPANPNLQTYQPLQQNEQRGICVPVQQNCPQSQPYSTNTQPYYPGQNSQGYNRPMNMCAPCSPSTNSYPTPYIGPTQPYSVPVVDTGLPYISPPAFVQPVAPVYTTNMPTPYNMPMWNQNPWTNPYRGNVPFSSSFTIPQENFFLTPNLQCTNHSPPPKPLGKLLFPTIFDFTHDSFFKMLIHMSGFEARNINISANRNSLELRAVKEEIEKQIDDFSGYILKQVVRIYHFPEPIEESKIQTSLSADVICIMIPWK